LAQPFRANRVRMTIKSPVLRTFSDPVPDGQLPVLDQAILQSRQNLVLERGFSVSLDEQFLLDRETAGVLSAPQTVFNLANIIVGVGVLSVPYALKQSGYSALLVIVVVIYVTGTTGKWIGACVDMVGKTQEAILVPRNAWDFGFMAQVSMGRKASIFINVVTVLEVWLALVTFMVMNGENAKLVWPSLSRTFTMPVLGVIAASFVFVPQHHFSFLSLLSTFSMVVAAAAMMASTFMLSQWADPYEHFGEAALFQWWNIPRSVGIIVFCFAGHPCFPGVRAGMKSPSQWGLCINISFFVAFAYYAAFGFLGYIVFGADLSETVTENLQYIRGARAFQTISAFCFLVKVQLTVPLLLHAIVVALWSPAAEGPQWPRGRILLVLGISTLTVLVALSLADKVAVVASLAGSLLVMITSVLFPAVVHIILTRRFGNGVGGVCACARYCVVMAFGFTMAVLGTGLAVKDLTA